MKYNNTIQAHVCCLSADPRLVSSISQALNSEYSISQYSDIDALSNIDLSMSNPIVVLCQHKLIVDNETEKLKQIRHIVSHPLMLVIGPSLPVTEQINVLKNGARGYFNESLLSTKLDEAIQLILHGEVWVERQVISGLIDELTHVPALTEEQQTALDSLSPKELEVAKLVSHGSTNKMIAKTMNITERTVKAHLTTIFSKMNLPDRLSLAIFFRDLR
jgi:DNA-binding NarL/FixJ family response regulator